MNQIKKLNEQAHEKKNGLRHEYVIIDWHKTLHTVDFSWSAVHLCMRSPILTNTQPGRVGAGM